MSQQPNQVIPIVPIVVELNRELSFLADPDVKTSQQLSQRIVGGLVETLRQLGIPGTPKVELKGSTGTLHSRLTVHGSPQEYSSETLQNLYEYFRTPDQSVLPDAWESVIRESLPQEDLPKFLAQLVVETAKQRPDSFLSTEQAAAYLQIANRLMPEASDTQPKNLPLEPTTNVLKYVLKLGLSIGDHRIVVKYITEGLAQGHHDEDIAEKLVSRLCSRKIEIEMNPAYLVQIVSVELGEAHSISVDDARIDDRVREQFTLARDALFYDLGIRIPNIVLVASESLREQAFFVKINHVGGLPRIGPKKPHFADQVVSLIRYVWHKLHPALSDEKGEGIMASKTTNLAIDPVGYITRALRKELRRNAWRVLHLEAIEYELALLHRAFPELVLTAMENISLRHLTQILRELLKEEFSIRDLRAILERILVMDQGYFTIIDDSLSYAQHVRAGLTRSAVQV